MELLFDAQRRVATCSRRESNCPAIQLSWTGFRMFVRHCIVYTPETFSIQNELCRRAEIQSHASRPKNAIDSGWRSLNAVPIFPEHEAATPLLHTYFNTWERTYRVVQKDVFWKEYYDTSIGIRRMSLSYRVLALAMLILGQRATDEEMDLEAKDSRIERFSTWVECVEHYCHLLIENQRLDLPSLQIMCLFSLYKATTSDRNEARRWLQKLVKFALQANLHIDPSKLDAMTEIEMKLRRQLWATIAEIDIQVALEHGNVLPWTASCVYHCGLPGSFGLNNLNDQVHLESKHVLLPPHLQIALYQSVAPRIALLRNSFANKGHAKSEKELTKGITIHIATLDGICAAFNMSNSDSESRILLRLHILRPIIKALQSLIYRLKDCDRLHETMNLYHKHAMEFLRVYLKLSTGSRNGSLVSCTLFEILSPIIHLYVDGSRIACIPHPPQTILTFVKSWAKFEFDNLDCLSDRAIREQLLLFLLSQYLKSKNPRPGAARLPHEMGSWRYGKVCSALAQLKRAPFFYLEMAEMAWA